MDELGDTVLLARAASGDRAAFGQIYDRHVRPVYWQAWSVVRDDREAEDVTQEVFVTTWRRIRAITPVNDSVLPWLLATAKFTALNAHRKSARRRADEMDDRERGSADVEREVENAEVRAEIDKAVAALAPVDRQLFDLCVEGDLSYEQAARTLGVSHATVRNRLHRLRARLRSDLRSMRELA